MADLIDRQAAFDEILSLHRNEEELLSDMIYNMVVHQAYEKIDALPSAEPEIVRCKDCKYYNPIGVCIEMSSAVCEDSFCCWAERRTDE